MVELETLPGEPVNLDIPVPPASADTRGEMTSGTFRPPFDVISSLHTSKPCKRPNRNRPIASVDPAVEDEEFVKRCRSRLAQQQSDD